MAFLVRITSRAERDLAHLYGEIADHFEAALKSYLGLKEAILSLEVQPNRCPVTRKRDKLRHLLYQVEVLHIRHCARPFDTNWKNGSGATAVLRL